MALVGVLKTLFTGDTRGLDDASAAALKQLNQVQRQVMSLSKNMEGAFKVKGGDGGDMLGGLGKIGVAAAGVAAAGLALKSAGDFAVGAAQQADKLAASGKTLGVIFGPAASKVSQTIEGLADSIGASRVETSQYAVQLGANLTNAGISAGDAAAKTSSILERAADMAKATGNTTAEAVGAIASTLRGEFDPIEKFGVSVKAAAVEAELLRQGAEKVDGQWTQQQKTLATLNLLMAQTDKYNGAAAESSGSATSAIDRLNAAWEKMSLAIGQAVGPAIAWVADKLTWLVKQLGQAATMVSNLWGGGSTASATSAADPVQELNKALDQTPAKLAAITKATSETDARWKAFAATLNDADAFGKDLADRRIGKMFGADGDTMKLLGMVRGGLGTDRAMKLAGELDRINASPDFTDPMGQAAAIRQADTRRPGLLQSGSREFYAAELAARTGSSSSADRTEKNTRSAADTLQKILGALKAEPQLMEAF
jgi:hypothetical protein